MGNVCATNSSANDGASGSSSSSRVQLSRAYLDSLYGPSSGSTASPYHPLGSQPVRVPKLFDLALEQLCVSLVDQQSLESVLKQQQRRRRGSIRIAEADGGSGTHTPTPSAASIWTQTPPVGQGHHGATRRYSSTDMTALPIYSAPHEKKIRSPSMHGTPRSPFHAHNVLIHSHGNAVPPLKRGRSMSLSSKESPELHPQLYQAGGTSTQRMLITNANSGSTSIRRDSLSSIGSTPLHAALNGFSVPSSPCCLGPTAYGTSPHHMTSPAHPPPLVRSGSSPGFGYMRGTTPTSMPTLPAQSWIDPPDFALPPTSRFNTGGTYTQVMEERSDLDEMNERNEHGSSLSTNTLLASGSVGVLGSTLNGTGPSHQLRLPDSLIQLIFNRLIAEELLTFQNIHLFTSSNLTHIDFSSSVSKIGAHIGTTNVNSANVCTKYSQELTDEWLHVLFEHIVRHHAAVQTMLRTNGMQTQRAMSSFSQPATPHAIETPKKVNSISPPAPATSTSSSSSSSISPPIALNSTSPPVRPKLAVTSPHRVKIHRHDDEGEDVQDEEEFDLPVTFAQRGDEETKEMELTSLLASTSMLPPMTPVRTHHGESSSSCTSPKLISSANSPHHGSIASLPLQRQLSAHKLNLDGMSTPVRNNSSTSSPQPPHEGAQTLLHSFSTLASFPHRVDPLPVPTTSRTSVFSLPLHNPMSITSPSPSLALYRHAPSLIHLNLTGCSHITNRGLQPLQACLMLNTLNLNACTQISDELLMCVLANKFYLETLELKGLKGVTDATLHVLGDKVKLKKLCLDQAAITDDGLHSLSGLTQLQYFSVGWCGKRVTERGLSWLAQNFRLHTLCIAFTGVQSLQFFAQLRFLKEINTAGCKIGEPGLKNASAFPHLLHAYIPRTSFREIPAPILHHGLQTLDMSFSSSIASGKLLYQFQMWSQSQPINLNVAPADIKARNTSIDRVDYVHEQVERVGLLGETGIYGSVPSSSSSSSSYLASSLNDNEFSSNSPVSQVAHTTADPMSSSRSTRPSVIGGPIQLKSLVLESCSVDNRVASVIGEHFTNLTHLNVSDTDMTSTGLLTFSHLKNLRSLNVSGCKIMNHGLAVLSKFTELQELSIDCPSITDVGLAFLRSLAPTLKRLDLFETPVSEAGLDHLLGLKLLEFLEICNGRLTNTGLAKLASNLPQLTSLNVSQNRQITDEGLEALRALRHLVHLNLSGCAVTQKGLAFTQPAKSDEGTNQLPLKHLSLFGCDIKATSRKVKDLPSGIQLGIDAGIVSIE